jgi:hypothetical protein
MVYSAHSTAIPTDIKRVGGCWWFQDCFIELLVKLILWEGFLLSDQYQFGTGTLPCLQDQLPARCPEKLAVENPFSINSFADRRPVNPASIFNERPFWGPVDTHSTATGG